MHQKPDRTNRARDNDEDEARATPRRKTSPVVYLCGPSGKEPVAGFRNRQDLPDLWEGRIRDAMDSARDRLGVRPVSGRLIRQYSPLEKEEAAFEIATDGGPIVAIRSRDGSLTFHMQGRII